MLTFLRRVLFSTAGKIIALALLVIIAVAFALGDITNLGGGGGPTGGALVQVGNRKVTEAELQQRLKNALERARQQQPTLDMGQFVAMGGFDQVLDDIISRLALEQYATEHGMAVSKAAVDGEIASSPAFADPITGQFNQKAFDQLLARQGVTADQVRADIRQGTLAQWVAAPALGAGYVPSELVMPYASLLLERRKGSVGYVPITAIDKGAAPTDAELTGFYNRHRARYTLPERRVIRYAVVRPEQFAGSAKATEVEIAAAYKQDAAKYAASTKRTLAQLIVADQNAANALAAKIKGGATLAAAAAGAGLQPSTIDNAEKESFARASSPQIADAAFAAAPGGVVGPLRSPLGWHIVRVEKIEQIAGKSLDQVRGEIAAEITKRKEAEALANLRSQIDSAIAGNATFDEAVADAKLKAETSPPLFGDGRVDQNNQGAEPTPPDPVLAQVAQGGFAMETSDDPQLVPVGQDGSFALIKTERVVAAAPRPLAQIRELVAADFIRDRQLQAARKAAVAILADVNKGTPITDAMKKTGLALPPLQPLDAVRGQLSQARMQIPPPVQLMFSIAAKKAKMTEAPNGGGYWVVWLDEIQPGNARGNQGLVAQTRSGLSQMIGSEYLEQFVAAARKSVNVKRDEAAIARLKAQLGGQSTGGN
ncbi:SurA N-terminal domain-containing protein [Sphingomonas sp. BT-65]|uniref:peptidylprolyl isomerase n=1 Tax=Sphingomonas sp. BT-65 TaxID=2989821 RepID=UPI0022362AC7|nr:peptidylprolyl isomerase [Sphingomonas sp. BT-65]MCW4460601.1 SurA N-terminal domain-containing protein [Sphingomonas sp. BT-65]